MWDQLQYLGRVDADRVQVLYELGIKLPKDCNMPAMVLEQVDAKIQEIPKFRTFLKAV